MTPARLLRSTSASILSTSLDGLHVSSDLRYQEIFPVGGTLSPKHHCPLDPLCPGSFQYDDLKEEHPLRDCPRGRVLAFCSAQPLNGAIPQGPVLSPLLFPPPLTLPGQSRLPYSFRLHLLSDGLSSPSPRCQSLCWLRI